MAVLRDRVSGLPNNPQALIALLLGATGFALIFTYSAYAMSPIVVPAGLLASAVLAIAASRPAAGICLAFVAAPLELYALPLPTGTLSASEGIFAIVGLAYVVRLTFRPHTVVKPSVTDLPYAVLLGAIVVGVGMAASPAPVLRIFMFWLLFYLSLIHI